MFYFSSLYAECNTYMPTCEDTVHGNTDGPYAFYPLFPFIGNKGTFSWVKAPGLSYELFLKTHLPGQGRLSYSSPTVISKCLSERIVSIRLSGFSTSCVYRCPFLSKVNMKKKESHTYTRTHKTAIHHIFLPPEL